jgi:hypothetical protein
VNVRHHTGSKKNQTPVLGSIRKVPNIQEGQRTCDTNRKCNVIYSCAGFHMMCNIDQRNLSFFSHFKTCGVNWPQLLSKASSCQGHCENQHYYTAMVSMRKMGHKNDLKSGTQGTGFSIITMQMVTPLCVWIFGYKQNECHSKRSFKATWHILFPKMKNSIKGKNI